MSRAIFAGLVALVLALAGCPSGEPDGDGGGTTTSTTDDAGIDVAPACGGAQVCPSGYHFCGPDGGVVVPCCFHEQDTIYACAAPAGILSNDCPASCTSGECAYSPTFKVTCCSGGVAPDPCDTPMQ